MRDRIVLLGVLVGLWGALSYSGSVSPLFLPTPTEVLGAFWQGIRGGTVIRDVVATMSRVVVGFVWGGILGVLLGVLIGSWRRLHNASAPFIDFTRSVPITAILPLFLLLFGIGNTANVAASAWASGLMLLINTVLGVASVPPTRLMVAATLRAHAYQRLFLVILPDALPQIFIGIRTAISFAVVVGVVSEMLLSTTAGIGSTIYNASIMYRTEEAYVGIFLAGAIGYTLNVLSAKLDERIVHWRGK
ncbi:MAG: ABC transporter permease [Acidobacteria bacterium]|nr:ABC transporter permease [Acidobacteriota bacterium]